MKSRYESQPEFRKRVHLFGSLAFVPQNQVIDAFEALQLELSEFLDADQDLEDYVAHFEQSFIGRLNRDMTRREPKYSIQEWSQYQNVMNRQQRTNNRIEGWHAGMSHLAASSHPNVFTFCDILKRDMSRSIVKIHEQQNGQAPQPQRRTYRELSERIRSILETFDDENIIVLLQRVSNVYHFY